jgi:hypothetical protein
MTSSNLVGCPTGKSPGFMPFRILCTYVAARRYKSVRSGPYTIRPPASANSLRWYVDGRVRSASSALRWRMAAGGSAEGLRRSTRANRETLVSLAPRQRSCPYGPSERRGRISRRPSPEQTPIQQLDLLRSHVRGICETRDDIAGRHEMGVTILRKCNGAAQYLAGRS